MLRWRGLPIQLLALIILPLTLILLIIAFGSLFLHQRAMRQLVGERDERATRAAASAISEQLLHREAATRSLALRAADLGEFEHVLDDAAFLLPDFDGGIALFDVSRGLVSSSNNSALWDLALWSEQLAKTSAMPNTAHFSDSVVDPLSGEEMIVVMATTEDGISAAGAFSPTRLAQEALDNVLAGEEQAAAFLTDHRGHLLFQVGDVYEPGIDLSEYDGVADALRGDSGTIYLTDGGEEQVLAYSPIPPLNWTLVIKEPWRAVADPLLRATELAPLILAPVLLVALVGLMFGLRQIVQPLQSLERKAADLGWGNYEAIEEPVGGIHEIQRLQTELIHMAHKVRVAQQSLRGYLGAMTIGQEEERRRIARDLHDDTIQALIALNQRIQLAQMSGQDEAMAEQLAEMQQMTEQTIADLRRLTRDLRPIYLEDLGLVTALSMLSRDTSQTLKIPVDFQVLGRERRLPADVELAFYRIGQEGLSNVARHAQATCAELKLVFGLEQTTFTLRDDGRGFNVPESPAEMTGSGHFGLLGIQERAEIIGARLSIESTPDEGSCLTISLPNSDPAG
jgi:signal transduction histidine kinase